ncbi:hypothetical protein [Lichenifustis flavocetrariae]|uniref:Uncharacterized protein n=1 Tax=Lichenifustis flavocetrariae TaxID=2949735 RepID=A0AA41Z0Y9_9HYPH|nr:hypothetical protein [Lichenifustis flavocetrariae]MCW6510961.1 hypothetical protein [Lichenifustis flavocetrariae]
MAYYNTAYGSTPSYGQSATPSQGSSSISAQQMGQANATSPLGNVLSRLVATAASQQPGQPMQLQGAVPQQSAPGGIFSQLIASLGNQNASQMAGPAMPSMPFSNGLIVAAPAQTQAQKPQQQPAGDTPLFGRTRFVNGLNVVG